MENNSQGGYSIQGSIELEDILQLPRVLVEDVAHVGAVGHLLEHALRVVAGVGPQVEVDEQQHLLGQVVRGAAGAQELLVGALDQHLHKLVRSQ